MGRQFYTYILTNEHDTVLYTGMTNNLARRAYEHRTGRGGGFTSKYKLTKLVYYEVLGDPRSAIERENQIKGGLRQRKIDLINEMSPEWRDLYWDVSG